MLTWWVGLSLLMLYMYKIHELAKYSLEFIKINGLAITSTPIVQNII